MKPDAILQELWRIKDEHSRRFDGDVRALCGHLMEKQRTPHPDMPLVTDFAASKAAHRARIAQLPPPVPGEVLLPEDPIMAELRAIRAELSKEYETGSAVVRENPPKPGE